MAKLHKNLKIWLKNKKVAMEMGKWQVYQKHKKTDRRYHVGSVADFVYSYEHPEYLHMILKIRADSNKKSGWRKRGYVYKLTYMTTRAKDGNVVNGQRPPVMGAGCYYSLMEKAKEHKFLR